MKQTGTIYAYTVIHVPLVAFQDRVPYVVAIVENNGEHVLTYVEGYEKDKELRIGMPVQYAHEDEFGNAIYEFV